MEGVGKLPVILFPLKFVHEKQEYFMLRLTLLTASCNTNSSLSVTAFYDLLKNDSTAPEMFPTLKWSPAPKWSSNRPLQMNPDPEMLPISLRVDHEIIPD